MEKIGKRIRALSFILTLILILQPFRLPSITSIMAFVEGKFESLRRSKQLAVMVIILPNRPDPTSSVKQFIAQYTGSEYDLFILHEGLPEDQMQAFSALTNVTFVDISAHFDSSLLLAANGKRTASSCLSRIGYRLMCRFMSGPVFWLPEFDSYEQLLRFDDDSRFTGPINRSLSLRNKETYAFAVFSVDSDECQVGFPELVSATYNTSLDVVRFGPNAWTSPWRRNRDSAGRNKIFYNNFEVNSLARLRSQHYRTFWATINEAGLFMSTRLGDAQVKTLTLKPLSPKRMLSVTLIYPTLTKILSLIVEKRNM